MLDCLYLFSYSLHLILYTIFLLLLKPFLLCFYYILLILLSVDRLWDFPHFWASVNYTLSF